MNTDKRIRKLAFGGVFTALIAVATMFLKLPVPITSGYVHLGDGMIFAASAYLGPWGAVAGALGSALARPVGRLCLLHDPHRHRQRRNGADRRLVF